MRVKEMVSYAELHPELSLDSLKALVDPYELIFQFSCLTSVSFQARKKSQSVKPRTLTLQWTPITNHIGPAQGTLFLISSRMKKMEGEGAIILPKKRRKATKVI